MSEADACPISRDDRKSAALADAVARPEAGFAPVRNFNFARDIMRSAAVRQGMDNDYFAERRPEPYPGDLPRW
jgi:hypothetical protein